MWLDPISKFKKGWGTDVLSICPSISSSTKERKNMHKREEEKKERLYLKIFMFVPFGMGSKVKYFISPEHRTWLSQQESDEGRSHRNTARKGTALLILRSQGPKVPCKQSQLQVKELRSAKGYFTALIICSERKSSTLPCERGGGLESTILRMQWVSIRKSCWCSQVRDVLQNWRRYNKHPQYKPALWEGQS